MTDMQGKNMTDMQGKSLSQGRRRRGFNIAKGYRRGQCRLCNRSCIGFPRRRMEHSMIRLVLLTAPVSLARASAAFGAHADVIALQIFLV
jgi:hypothetical protein